MSQHLPASRDTIAAADGSNRLITRELTLVDAHVHVHPGVDRRSVIRAVTSNVARVARAPEFRGFDSVTAVLCLSEIQSIDAFADFERGGIPEFDVTPTNEPHTLVLKRNAAASSAADTQTEPGSNAIAMLKRHGPTAKVEKVVLVAGRQIATSDGLEILALGTRDHFEDGSSIHAVLDELAKTKTRAVLPWGFGKWIGRRGRLVKDILEEADPESGFALGDSGNRPQSWPAPPHFDIAYDRNIAVLPGTDPLPLTAEHWRTASFGFAADVVLSNTTPWADLNAWVSQNARNVRPFGDRTATADALRSQLVLRLS